MVRRKNAPSASVKKASGRVHRISSRLRTMVSSDSQQDRMRIQDEGYVNVRVKIDIGSNGNENGISFVSVSKNDPNSICLFVAGGTDIDKKVEEANARLTRKCK